MIYISKFIIPKKFNGLTIWPFIFLRHKELKLNKILVNHEVIHLKQQLELLVLPFFIWYGIEYLFRLVQYKDAFNAYKNISFEREAYANEKNLDYLKHRKLYSFFNYLNKKNV
jgi:hypothetical protein